MLSGFGRKGPKCRLSETNKYLLTTLIQGCTGVSNLEPTATSRNRSMPSVVDGLENSGEARQKDGEKTRDVICRARNQRDRTQSRLESETRSSAQGLVGRLPWRTNQQGFSG
ncbi:hypothetical protein QQF64_010551 [Cirrhinus molitorella]|uniref:Uncharacterized protein n=2 Tax=Cirrhinus molitorella TaxID=172907 RepID=A0ABR3M7F4_9TELE